MVDPAVRALSRDAGDGRPPAPVRIAHLGLGGFFRAHQAWYTDRAPDAGEWGIAAFTGRRPVMAEALAPQQGLYTLITRGAERDQLDVVSSLSRAHAADDHAAWLGYLRSPDLGVVTLTVTEAGYLRGTDGRLDVDATLVRADVSALRGDMGATVRSVPGRLVAGFAARRASGVGPLAVVPCDNLPDNGAAVRAVVDDLTALVDPRLATWVDRNVSFVTTMVDRITPETTECDRTGVLAATGHADAAPVVTEPFSEWVLHGEFPAGRPRWEDAGARLVPDVAPFEQRKLWLLNGGHSLLAYAGAIRGHATVADAMADPTCRSWLEQWWDEASRHLTLPAPEVTAYREVLLERFANPRIRHLLSQVAADGSHKLPVRIVPVLRLERAGGRMPGGATRILGAWVCHLRGSGAAVNDAGSERILPLARGPLPDATRRLVRCLDADLAEDDGVVADVLAQARDLGGR